MIDDDPHWLYRISAGRKDRDLLYVGITNSIPRRMGEHQRDKEWFPASGQISFRMYADRESVLAAEEKAIRRERPAHNIQHNTVRIDVSVRADVNLSVSNVAGMMGLGLGLFLLAKWGTDAYAVRRARVLAERQGLEHESPQVACPFTEKPLSAPARMFYVMLALAGSPPPPPPPPAVQPGNPESVAAFHAWYEQMTALSAGSPGRAGSPYRWPVLSAERPVAVPGWAAARAAGCDWGSRNQEPSGGSSMPRSASTAPVRPIL